MDISRPSTVSSSDLNQTKYTFESLIAMRAEFPGMDDEALARFLIARNGDISKSVPMLKAHIEWKQNIENWPILKVSTVHRQHCTIRITRHITFMAIHLKYFLRIFPIISQLMDTLA